VSAGIMRGAIVASLVLVLAIPASMAAQTPEPVEIDDAAALYQADDRTQVLSTEDWCAYFTEGGWFMPIDACVAQVIFLLGDPEARYVPQALVPEDPAQPRTAITKKGKNNRETGSFRLAAGTYKVDVSHKNCGEVPTGFLLPVGKQEVTTPRILSDGSVIHGLEAGKYAMEVIGWPKVSGGKPCTWQIKLTPEPG
jgi:hypothetical protein